MKPTILIVDDDENMLLLLRKMFEKKYIIYTACDGVEAISYLSQGILPDLIITDIVMDKIDGYELIRFLSTSGIFNTIPVIILSSLPQQEIEKNFPAIRAIHKPFDPLDLIKKIDSALSSLTAETLYN